MWWHALPSACIHSFLYTGSETFGCWLPIHVRKLAVVGNSAEAGGDLGH